MQETPNLKLKKPDLTDYVNVGDLNENADVIDTAVTLNKTNIETHENKKTNPHGVTKAQVGLGNVDNVKQASKSEHDALSNSVTTHLAEKATLTTVGHVQLSSDTDSESETKAVTPKALKVVNDLTPILIAIASDDVRASSPSLEEIIAKTYTKVKEVRVGISGTIRVNFSFKGLSSATREARIYINNIAVGQTRTSTSSTLVKYRQDFTVNAGDLIQLYIRTTSAHGLVDAEGFEICYTLGQQAKEPIVLM